MESVLSVYFSVLTTTIFPLFFSVGVNLIVGTETGLYLLDRSGYGKGGTVLVIYDMKISFHISAQFLMLLKKCKYGSALIIRYQATSQALHFFNNLKETSRT